MLRLAKLFGLNQEDTKGIRKINSNQTNLIRDYRMRLFFFSSKTKLRLEIPESKTIDGDFVQVLNATFASEPGNTNK